MIRKGRSSKAKKSSRWSGRVTQTSNAMTLEKGVFQSNSPPKNALSLKRSAERSRRRKAGPYQSAMSMLNFYINRGGKNLSLASAEFSSAPRPNSEKLSTNRSDNSASQRLDGRCILAGSAEASSSISGGERVRGNFFCAGADDKPQWQGEAQCDAPVEDVLQRAEDEDRSRIDALNERHAGEYLKLMNGVRMRGERKHDTQQRENHRRATGQAQCPPPESPSNQSKKYAGERSQPARPI